MKLYLPIRLNSILLAFAIPLTSWASPQAFGIENVQALSFGSFVPDNGGFRNGWH